jgi:flagellar motility protein MotE (MotC chaperone)
VEGPTGPSAPRKTEAAEAKKPTEAAKPADGNKAEQPGEAKPAGAKSGGKSGEKNAAKSGEKAASESAAAKPADKPGKGKAKPMAQHERASPSAAPLPALSQSALRQEIKQNGGEDKSATAAAPTSERARLEQLAAEITKAREALKQDTARLETMLKGGGDGRMPIGDGMGSPASGVDAGGAASREAMKEQILTVSKAMKGMKPEQAAAIIARMDRGLASEILRRMKPADAGAVMASIKPELAADLATTIATRRSMVDGDPKKDGKK